MKDRALLHLLLASARAAEAVVGPASVDRLRQATTTLAVERPGRGELRVSWSDPSGRREATIASSRFTFARRGDVAGVVARRPAEVDDRTANWREALRLWTELLDVPDLAARIDDVPRTVNGPRLAEPTPRVAPFVIAATALIVALVARFVLAGSTAAAGLGVALVAAVTVLVPFRHEDARLLGARLAGVLAVALAWNGAPMLALVAAGGLLLADVAVLVLQQDRRRLIGTAVALAATVAAAGVAGAGFDPVADDAVTGGGVALVASVAAALVLLGIGVVSFFRGVRDRLSAWLMPVGFVVAALGSFDTWASAGWLGGAAIALVATTVARPSRRAVARPAPAPVGTAVQVSFGRQSASV